MSVVDPVLALLAFGLGRKAKVRETAVRMAAWIVPIVAESREVNSQTKPDYTADDVVPVVIEGREAGRIAVRELLP
jgi:hypothetical protein